MLTIKNIYALAYNRRPICREDVENLIIIWSRNIRHLDRVFYLLLASGVFPDEAHGGCKYDIALLTRLDRSRREGATRSNAFYVVYNRDFGATGQYKITVHTMDIEIFGNRLVSSS